jgi:hypothetical protein
LLLLVLIPLRLLLLRVHDLLVPLFLELLQRHVRTDARLLLLNGRAVDGVVKVNGGVVVELLVLVTKFLTLFQPVLAGMPTSISS